MTPSDQTNRDRRAAQRRQQAKDAAIDASLVTRLKERDEEALSQLYDRHATTVYSVAMSILRDPGLAEDVTHDAFITLWSQPDRYDPSLGRFAPWFYRVARNRSIDIIRRHGREVIPEEPVLFDLSLSDSNPGPDESTLLSAEAELVREAVRQLPSAQRELIELAYFTGMTQAEMSDRLDIPLGTVKTRIRTGMRRLRSLLDGHD
ncbi:MAG: RNA polymerase sigma factor [Chloroflexota bacterium]